MVAPALSNVVSFGEWPLTTDCG